MSKLAWISFLTLTVVGCGKKVLVPEKTIVAAYIDLEKAYGNGKTVASTLIDALPSDRKSVTKKDFEAVLKLLDKFNDNLYPEWAVVTLGGNLREIDENKRYPEKIIAVAVKVNAGEDAVKNVLKDVFDMDDVKSDKKDGHIVFDFDEELLGLTDGKEYLGLVDGKYVIYSPSGDAFDAMFDLYAGKGKASDEFDDLSNISGNTICRISTAPVANLLKRFELTREIEKFGEVYDNRDLVDMVLNMGPISLDVGVGDELGLAVHVNCDSSRDAKAIEKLMRSAAFLARLGWDACAVEAKNHTRWSFFTELSIPVEAKDIFINLARNVEADRSWNVATLSVALQTSELIVFIEKMSSEKKSGGDGKDGDRGFDTPLSEGNSDADKGDYAPSTNVVNATNEFLNIYPASSFYDRKRKTKKPDSSYSSYSKYVERRNCISNMKRLRGAAEKYMLNHGSMPTIYDLCGPGKYLRTKPTCPKDGSSYRIFRENGIIKVSCPNAHEDHKL